MAEHRMYQGRDLGHDEIAPDGLADTPDWLGMVAASRYLGVHRSTLHLAVRQGEIQPDARTPGGHIRFRPETLEAFKARLIDAPAAGGMAARLRALTDLPREISTATSARDACRTVLGRIRQVESAVEMGYIAIHRPTERDPLALRPLAAEALPGGFFDAYQRLRPNYELAASTALCSGKPRVFEDMLEEPLPRGALLLGHWMRARARPVRSLVALPLVAYEHPIGVLVVISSAPRAFGPSEMLFLTSVAGLLSLALVAIHRLKVLESSAGLIARALELRSENGGDPPLADLASAYLNTSGADAVYADGIAGDVPEAAPEAANLARAARAAGAVRREWFGSGARRRMGLAVPLPVDPGGASVTAVWPAERENLRTERALLTVFGGACVLAQSAPTRDAHSAPTHDPQPDPPAPDLADPGRATTPGPPRPWNTRQNHPGEIKVPRNT